MFFSSLVCRTEVSDSGLQGSSLRMGDILASELHVTALFAFLPYPRLDN